MTHFVRLQSVTEQEMPGHYLAMIVLGFSDGSETTDVRFGVAPDDPFGIAPDVRAAVDQWIADGKAVSDYVAPAPTSEQINAERDRRTAEGFTFQSVAYQLDGKSQQNVIAKGAQAKFAVLNGAAAGDLRWAHSDNDFAWIATDNSITPMDAQTMAAMADAADFWVTAHIMAARMIKNLIPIPADYATNAYWPATAE